MKDSVFSIVKGAIDDINEELNYDSLRNVDHATPLYGGTSGIDSLSLVTLISELEMQVSDHFGTSVILADEKALSMKRSPYRNVGTLVDFTVERLETANV
jgi:acyl carrier protein